MSKLPLTVRMEIEKMFTKEIPAHLKKINDSIGVDWIFEFDFPALYEKLPEEKKTTIGRYSENIVKNFASEVKRWM
jgi:hypothetical protein